MPGFANHTTRVSSSVGRQHRAVVPSYERTRHHAIGLSRTNATCTDDVSSSGRSIPREPDAEKDLPRIPSTSTELWGTEPATMSSEMAVSPAISPTPGLRSHAVPQNLRRTPTTEAQKIVARYHRRHDSLEALRSEVFCSQNLEVSSLISDTLLVSLIDLVDMTSAPRWSY